MLRLKMLAPAAALALAALPAAGQARVPAAQQHVDAYVVAVTRYCLESVTNGVGIDAVAPVEGYSVEPLEAAEAASRNLAEGEAAYRLKYERGFVILESKPGASCRARAAAAAVQQAFDGIEAAIKAQGYQSSLNMDRPPTTFMRLYTRTAGDETFAVLLNGIQPRGAPSNLAATVTRSATAPRPAN